MNTKNVEVHYVVKLSEEDFKRLLSKAEEYGYGGDDVAPNVAVRELLMMEGLDKIYEGGFEPQNYLEDKMKEVR